MGAALGRECTVGCINVVVQILCAFVCVLVALWAASLLLEWVELIPSLTTVPPGIRFADYTHPAFIPDPNSPLSAKAQLDAHRAGRG